MRGHGSGHHHQGAQSILELGAVKDDSLRSLLRKRKNNSGRTEGHGGARIKHGQGRPQTRPRSRHAAGRKKPSLPAVLALARELSPVNDGY